MRKCESGADRILSDRAAVAAPAGGAAKLPHQYRLVRTADKLRTDRRRSQRRAAGPAPAYKSERQRARGPPEPRPARRSDDRGRRDAARSPPKSGGARRGEAEGHASAAGGARAGGQPGRLAARAAAERKQSARAAKRRARPSGHGRGRRRAEERRASAQRGKAALQCASIPTMPGGLPHGEASERAGARERRRSRNGGDGSDHAPRGNERRAQLRHGCRASAPRAAGATKRSRHHRGGVEGLRHSTPPWCSLIIDHVFGQIA